MAKHKNNSHAGAAGQNPVRPEIVNTRGRGRFVLICDHASNHIPGEYDNLGLPGRHLNDHIAYDIGAAELTLLLTQKLDCVAVMATASRLVIDVNRETDHPTLIPEHSDGVAIPGNRPAHEVDRDRRIADIFDPHHAACEAEVKERIGRAERPIVMAVHSFTDRMAGETRPWEAAFLWDKDPRLAQGFIRLLRDKGHTVGDNEPYSGKSLFYTMRRHGASHGLAQATLEIRQDLLADARGIETWADIIAEGLLRLAGERTMFEEIYYDEDET